MPSIINSKHLVLDLLYASNQQQSSIQRLICAANVFGYSENAIRVAISRLASEDYLYPVERACYALTYKAYRPDVRLLTQFQTQSSDVWQGHYYGISYAQPYKSSRHFFAKQQAVLLRLGFRALHANFYIRPHNLNIAVVELKQNLLQLGFSTDCLCMHVSDIATTFDMSQLWDMQAIEDGYRNSLTAMQQFLAELPHVHLEEAAAQVFHLVKQAIRLRSQDPYLPNAFCDLQLRQHFNQVLTQLEQHGKQLWATYFQSQGV